MPQPVSRLAPAKINLALHVTGRRDDGYHLLDTLVVFTRFGDTVSVSAAETDCFAVSGPRAGGLPADTGNLVLRARDLLRSIAPDQQKPVSIRLDKHLPTASGIGGGSSDAAAALRALTALWHMSPDEAVLQRAALRLGADLPMCLVAEPLMARGIGEKIEQVPRFPALPLVLVNPGIEVPTPAVFARLEQHENPPMDLLPAFDDVTAVAQWLFATRNDLEAPAMAVAPVIGDALTALRATDALLARMSGSGATCYGLFASDADAAAAAERITAERPGWFVQATRSFATGEFHGGN